MSGIIGTSHSKSKVIGRSRDTAKAWVSFRSSPTMAIHNDYNVSSLTDNAVGDTTITFSSALPVNFTASAMTWSAATVGNRGASGVQFGASDTASASGASCRVFSAYGANNNTDGAKEDSTYTAVNFFGG